MSGDLAGTFVARRDAAVHLAVAELARGLNEAASRQWE